MVVLQSISFLTVFVNFAVKKCNDHFRNVFFACFAHKFLFSFDQGQFNSPIKLKDSNGFNV